jgi:phosphatidate cytidylyltransferase
VLRQRLITGSLLIVGLVLLLWGDERLSAQLADRGDALPWWTGGGDGLLLDAVALLLLAPLLARELARMLRGSGVAAPTWLTVLAAMLGVETVGMLPLLPGAEQAIALGAAILWALLALSLIVHTRGRRIEGAVAATGATLLSFVYIGAMLGMWVLVRRHVGPWVVAGAILTVKASDMGAYFTGVAFGRHKMIPWLSPAKSWEGFAGGVAASALVGAGLAALSLRLPDARDHVPAAVGAVAGLALGVVAPFGDLVESLFKRSAGVKDSGTALPGMGGAFDVLDSPLLAGPVVYGALLLLR